MIFLILLLLFPLSVSAETRLTREHMPNILTKEGNPYILETDVSLSSKLIIREGVVIMTASSTRTPWQNYTSGPYIEANGGVEMAGTEKEPIHLIGLAPTLIRRPVSSRIEHVWFENSPLYLQTSSDGPFGATAGEFLGTTTMISSTFSDSAIAPGIEVNSGAVVIENSEIQRNPIGILSDVTAYKTDITVHNSSIIENKKFEVQNNIQKAMKATDNWWGSSDGPGERVSGLVLVEPWKKEDPQKKCCSNVLFLPGLQASRLYRTDGTLLGSTTRRVWEPYTNQDVRTLFLDENGESIDPTIHARDVIDSAYGVKGIYKNFIAMMNGVVAEKKINEWLPFAYDWRRGVPDVADEELVQKVEELAQTSRTGKVTVIAHSNGGLVAKMLGRRLEELGKSALLDRVILTAVPQLGTPQAVAGLLHGDSQEILKGLTLRGSVARALGQNMTSAYGLLPSEEFFSRVSEPVLAFAGKAVGSYDSFVDFLQGGDGRAQPSERDLKSPTILSSSLLQKAQSLHSLLDRWKFPTTTSLVSLAGWGIPTTKTIEYASGTPKILKTGDGDGTVHVESARNHAGQTLFFNQGLFNFDHHVSIDHSNILESDVVRNFLTTVLATTTLPVHNQHSSYLTMTKPGSEPWMKWLTISVHSPVDLHLYDSRGGHMGPLLLPDSDLELFENTIGGQIDTIGDEKYYTIPADDTYSVRLEGTGIGTFTFQVQKYAGAEMNEVANVVYEDVPVTPLLTASTTITGTAFTSPLNLDVDGNGGVDIQTGAGGVDPQIHFASMKTIIRSLGLDSKEEKQLMHRIEKLSASALNKEKFVQKLKAAVEKAGEGHWNLKNLTEANRQLLTSMFHSLLLTLESND